MTKSLEEFIRPSNLGRLAACPGSAQLEAQCPEVAESEYAAEGTRLHDLMADAAKNRTEEEEEIVQRTLNVRLKAQTVIGIGEPCGTFREMKVAGMGFRGTTDFCTYDDKGNVLIADYKFGRLEVPEAHENFQVRAYVVMVWDTLIASGIQPTIIYAAIIRPWAPKEQQLSLTVYSATAIEQARSETSKLISAAMATDAPRSASEAACRYCTAKAFCPEARAAVLTLGPKLLSALTVELLPGEQLSSLLDIGKRAAKVIEALEAEAKRRLNAGEKVPGWDLKEGASMREVVDPQKAFAAVYPEIDATTFASCCTVSVVKLEEAYGAALEVPKKKRTFAIAQALGDTLQLKHNAPSLVRSKAGSAELATRGAALKA